MQTISALKQLIKVFDYFETYLLTLHSAGLLAPLDPLRPHVAPPGVCKRVKTCQNPKTRQPYEFKHLAKTSSNKSSCLNCV
jgi:hypothetical protein